MTEYPLINKKELRKNKQLKSIQKESQKKYRAVKGHFPKAKIGKVVRLSKTDSFFDFTSKDYTMQNVPSFSSEYILNEIKNQNVCGLSGSGFPAYQKLQTLIDSKADDKYLIINGVECDPGLLHDDWLLKNRFKELKQGIELLSQCADFKKIILATKESTAADSKGFNICTVPCRYPMGAEKILIRQVLGIDLAPEEIPANKGILIFNLQTVHAVYEAVYMKRPADSRFITAADLSSGDAVVARVFLNSDITEVASKIFHTQLTKPVYHGGGIMMAAKTEAPDQVTVKTNFIGYGDAVSHYQNDKCKKCGACSRKCPMQLKVHKLVQAVETNDLNNISDFHPERCIKCGTCTYFCHAGKNVMELVSSIKG